MNLLMHKDMRIIIPGIVLFCIFVCTTSYAEQPETQLKQRADSIYSESKALFKNYEYDKAIEKFQQTLEINRKLNSLEGIVNVLNSIGEAYYKLSKYDTALIYYDSTLVMARDIEDRTVEARALCNIGFTYYSISQYDRAQAYGDSALIIAREENDKFIESRSLWLGGAITFLIHAQFDSALLYFESALANTRDIRSRKEESNNLHMIGYVYLILGQFNKALAYYDSAIVIRREIKDMTGVSSSLRALGGVYEALCQYEKALAYYDSALVIRRGINDERGESHILYRIANTYYSLSQNEKALFYFDSVLVIARKKEDRSTEASVLRHIGQIYYDFGQYDKALTYYDSALVILKDIDIRRHLGVMFSYLGDVYCAMGKCEKAICYQDTAVKIMRQVKDKWGEGSALSGIGDAYYGLEKYNKAHSYYDSALAICKNMKHRLGEGCSVYNIGEIYRTLGQYSDALTCYDSALAITKEVKNRSVESSVLDAIGRVFENVGDIEKAISYYEQSIDIKESIRKKLQKEELRKSYIEVEKDVYERLVTLLIMLERYEEAFDYLERSRSEKLYKSFEQGEMIAYDPSLKRQLERINFLTAEMFGLRKRFAEGKIEEEKYTSKMNELEGQINQQLLDLKNYHPELYSILVPRRRSLKYIQGTIPENTVFLEFALGGEKYIVFVIARDLFLTKPIEMVKEEVDSVVEELLFSISTRAGAEEFDGYCMELYNVLFKQIENDVQDFEHLVIIPYGSLHYLPFHALKRQMDGEIKYFMEWKQISYLPSASFLEDMLRGKSHAKKDLLAFANCDGTLPSAEIEVDSIRRIYHQSLVFKADSATKERFIEHSPDYRMLHLATHAVLDADPRFSHLVMAPEGTGDLTVRDIIGYAGQFRNTVLVTLSACETAVERDPENAGMELTALSNAFRVAGVPSIVATLWEIADRSTAILMTYFYKNLKKEDINKLEALRQAQIEMVRHERYSHPFYWAPFILIGDWR